jgi:hypothetical protein
MLFSHFHSANSRYGALLSLILSSRQQVGVLRQCLPSLFHQLQRYLVAALALDHQVGDLDTRDGGLFGSRSLNFLLNDLKYFCLLNFCLLLDRLFDYVFSMLLYSSLNQSLHLHVYHLLPQMQLLAAEKKKMM